jgi:hypothetical protein
MNYTKIYHNIINKAKSQKRIKNKEVYYEAHHIIPKCMGGEGKYKEWNYHPNIVLLTAREHFLCHLLLVEIYPNNNKLSSALWRMCNSGSNSQRYKPSSRIYEYSRIVFINSKKGKPLSENHKNSISLGGKGRIFSKEHKQKIATALTGRIRPDLSLANSKRVLSQETKNKISNSNKGKSLGKVLSEETKNKMSVAAKEKWKNKKNNIL